MGSPKSDLAVYIEEQEKFLLERQHLLEKMSATIDPTRAIHLALSAGRRKPELFRCTRESWVLALLDAAFFGIEPNPVLGHGYLIPFKNKYRDNQLEVQFMLGYKGKIALIEDAGLASNITPRVVYDCDDFELAYHLEWEGKAPFLHTPELERPEDARLHSVYTTATLASGERKFVWLPREGRQSVEYYRSKSRAATNGPWVDAFEAMAMKTAVHRLCDTMSIRPQSRLGLARLQEATFEEDGTFRHAVKLNKDATEITGDDLAGALE